MDSNFEIPYSFFHYLVDGESLGGNKFSDSDTLGILPNTISSLLCFNESGGYNTEYSKYYIIPWADSISSGESELDFVSQVDPINRMGIQALWNDINILDSLRKVERYADVTLTQIKGEEQYKGVVFKANILPQDTPITTSDILTANNISNPTITSDVITDGYFSGTSSDSNILRDGNFYGYKIVSSMGINAGNYDISGVLVNRGGFIKDKKYLISLNASWASKLIAYMVSKDYTTSSVTLSNFTAHTRITLTMNTPNSKELFSVSGYHTIGYSYFRGHEYKGGFRNRGDYYAYCASGLNGSNCSDLSGSCIYVHKGEPTTSVSFSIVITYEYAARTRDAWGNPQDASLMAIGSETCPVKAALNKINLTVEGI